MGHATLIYWLAGNEMHFPAETTRCRVSDTPGVNRLVECPVLDWPENPSHLHAHCREEGRDDVVSPASGSNEATVDPEGPQVTTHPRSPSGLSHSEMPCCGNATKGGVAWLVWRLLAAGRTITGQLTRRDAMSSPWDGGWRSEARRTTTATSTAPHRPV